MHYLRKLNKILGSDSLVGSQPFAALEPRWEQKHTQQSKAASWQEPWRCWNGEVSTAEHQVIQLHKYLQMSSPASSAKTPTW